HSPHTGVVLGVGDRFLCASPARPPIPTLFPYTTLFRSNGELEADLTGPKTIEAGDSTEFVLETTAESEVPGPVDVTVDLPEGTSDRKSTRLNSSHVSISYAVFCLKKKNPTYRCC